MADDSNSGWEAAPQGASSLQARMYATDAALQASHPNWPTGGTAAQIQQESQGRQTKPDGSPIVSSAGAVGIAQFEPKTFDDVKKQMGQPGMDINNINDQLAAHQYLMKQNLDRAQGHIPNALSLYDSGKMNSTSPETQDYISKFAQRTGSQAPAAAQPIPTSADDSGWESAPTKASNPVPDDGWENPNQDTGPNAIQQAGNWLGDKASGIGQVAASMGTGMVGMAAGGLRGLADIATGNSAQASSDIANTENALTYQPRTATGKAMAGGLNDAMDKYVTQPLKQGGETAVSAIPFVGEDLAKEGYAKDIADVGTGIFENFAPLHLLPGGIGRLMKGKDVSGAAAELDKLNAGTQPPPPAATPPNMGPNEGPPRPPISVDSRGNAVDPLADPNMAAYMQNARDQQAAAQVNEPYTMQANEGPQQAPTREPLIAGTNGDVGTAAQMSDPGYLAAKEGANSGPSIPPDVLEDRMQTMRDATPEQLDLFNNADNADRPYDRYAPSDKTSVAEGYGEPARSLTSDEFEGTLQNLADKDGTRFQIPDVNDPARGPFMDAAYEHYTDLVHDTNGDLFDRPTMAKNFADMALKDSLTRRIQEHPVVKANQAKVDQLKAQEPTPFNQQALAAAQALLQKSTDNIGSHFKEAAKQLAPWEKDGVVYMHTFGDLSTLSKSIGAVLKGIHGVVFKTLDRVLPKFRSLDGDGKIFAQGIKDAINRQANKEWDTKPNEKPIQKLQGIPGMRKALDAYNPYEAQGLSDGELKSSMQQANDISDGFKANAINHVLQGGQQLTSFHRSPLVKFVTESVDRAQRNTKDFVRNQLVGKNGLRTKLQAMSDDELTGIWSHMQLNEGRREFSAGELKNLGFSDKQADFYTKRMALNKQVFAENNAARLAAGLRPMDPRIAHIAGYFNGDFKQVIRGADGNVVAVIAHNYKNAVQTLTKRFMEDHPDAANLKADPIEMNKLKDEAGSGDHRYEGYMNILNELKDSNADVSRIVQTYQDFMTQDAMQAMANRAKFKSKEGVLGAEGRKSWQSAKQNAIDGARQDLKYFESAKRFSEMQQAIEKSKKFVTDPEINKPNAKALATQYLDSVQGRNQGVVSRNVNGLINGFSEATGVGPSVLKGMNNGLKTAVLAKFVGIMKLSHSAVTLMQPILGMPFTNALMRSRGLDIPWMHGTAVKSVANSFNSSFKMFTKDKTGDPFLDAAKDYMQKNGTADVGMTNHWQNVTSMSKTRETVGNVAHANVSIPEAGARTFTFMYYAHMLQDMGLPKDEIFPTAHNAMREVMVDYGAHERPMMFGKMSLLGDIASTLTRFKYNTVGKHLIGAAEVQRNGAGMAQVLPLVHMIGASIAGAGIRGIAGYEAANQAIKWITQIAATSGLMKNSTSLDEMVLNSMHGLQKTIGGGMTDVLNWGGLAALGVNMTGSLSNSDTIPMDPLGALIPGQGELGTLAKSAANLAINHNKQSLKQFAVNVLTPNSMKGIAENQFFTDKDGTFHNPQTGLKEVTRTPGEQVERDFSFRPLNESKRALTARTLQNVEGGDSEDSKGFFNGTSGLKHDFLERAKSDIMSNNGQVDPQKMQQWAHRYISVGGDPSSFQSDMSSFLGKGQHLDRLQRAEGIPTGGSLSEITRYLRGKAME